MGEAWDTGGKTALYQLSLRLSVGELSFCAGAVEKGATNLSNFYDLCLLSLFLICS